MHTTEVEAEPIIEDGRCVGWKPGATVTACSRCDEQTAVIHPVETRPAMDIDGWTYRDGTLSVTCNVTDRWKGATIAGYLTGAGFRGYAGNPDDITCFTVGGTFAADEGGSTVISDHPDETLSVPVTFTPDDTETYAPCSFTLAITVTADACPYVDDNGSPMEATRYSGIGEMPTDGTASGWYAVTEDRTISGRLIINGDVNLILCDGKTLDCIEGIQLSGGSLTVWGQQGGSGMLKAAGKNGNAGIGGGSAGPMGGSLTVHSGKVNASGESGASGIGGGEGQNGGTVTILGGRVEAKAMGGGTGAIGAGVGGTLPGTLVLGDDLSARVVNADSASELADRTGRESACQRYWSAVITACSHTKVTFQAVDHFKHAEHCRFCMHDFGESEHTYEEDGYICTRCGDAAVFNVILKWYSSEDQTAAMMYEVNRGEKFNLGRDIPGFGDLVFRGWNIYENKTIDDVDSYLPAEGMTIYPTDTAYTVTCDILVQAVFGIPCTVAFDPGKGTGTMADEHGYEGDAFILPGCTFGHDADTEFAGWTVNGGDEVIPAGEEVTLTGDTKLTAIWKYAFGEADMCMPAGIAEVAESAFEGMPVTSVWIPDSCVSVGDHAFRNCTKLTRIRIPKDCGMGEGVLKAAEP